MNSNTDNHAEMTLWGTPHSLYTGKLRSYLIKKRLPYRELFPHHPRFQTEVLPAVRLMVVPVLETPEGQFIQDTSDIIDALEIRFPESPMVPVTPVQRTVAHLLDGYGSECLLAAAMHYRWSYRAEQEHFLQAEFGRATHCGPDRTERLKAGAQLMAYFNGFLPGLGVTPQTIPAVEAAYEELLDALDIHFQHHPYLLGGRPSIADFGFMAPLFAHLGRDPVPAAMMMKRAPNVYRWTERMNRAQIADGEFPNHAEDWLADDAIPATLEPILKLVFQDWGPQLLADAAFVNAWLQANAGLPSGHMVSVNGERTVHPVLGMIAYAWRGVTMQRGSMPHGLWHFERAAQLARSLSGPAHERFADLVNRLGGDRMMQIELVRPLARQDHVLVLA